MSPDKAISEAMGHVPDCLAAAYIDIGSGFLLCVRTVDSHPQAVVDMVATVTADLFQGPNVTLIENHFKASRGVDPNSSAHYFQEMLIFSENLIHVFARTKRYPEHVVCFVCRKSANIGMVLTKSRMAIDSISDEV